MTNKQDNHLDAETQRAVTEQLFRAIRESQNLMSVLDECSMVSITDVAGTITYANNMFVEVSGYSVGELVGQNHRIVNSHLHPDQFWHAMWQTISSGYPWRNVVCNRAKCGRLYWVDTQISPLFTEAGAIEQYVSIRTDITKLVNATAAAKVAGRVKSQFMTNMSHEIRTPMNAILGLLTLMQETSLTTLQRGYADKAAEAAQSLLTLVNDVLDFSDIDVGQLSLHSHPFRMDELLRELSDRVLADLAGKSVVAHFELDSSLPPVLIGDAKRLHQVLGYLTDNAIKFTGQGEIIVQITMLRVSDGKAVLRFSVRDSGIGIALEQHEHIFSDFSQVDATLSRPVGGKGLGLSIARKLVNLMGGDLALVSAPGQGSTFYFTVTLPVAEPVVEAKAKVSITVEEAGPLSGMRLLVVEDNVINQLVARQLLSARGATVVIAANGQLGVDSVVAAEPPFDAILMDLQMPVMDGFAATQAIRVLFDMNKLPIIALTTSTADSDRADCLAAGMNEHVGKPFNVVALVALLRNLTGRAKIGSA